MSSRLEDLQSSNPDPEPSARTALRRRGRRLLRRNKRYLYRVRMPLRLLTAGARTLPRFLIIGAQRGGTTSLYTYLSEHPQVLRAARKEIHFFDRHFHEGETWYRAHFPLESTMARREKAVGKPVLTGEATPYYLFHPDAPRRIASTLSGVRLIALLRDPVARAYSHYNLTAGEGLDRMSFEEAVRWEQERLLRAMENGTDIGACYGSRNHMRHSYLARSIYVSQLKIYFDLFDRRNVHVASSEDLFRSTQATYDRVLNFLGLEPHVLKSAQMRNIGLYGRANLKGLDATLIGSLRTFFAPFNRSLYELVGTDFHWDE
ncbi:MAG TPA: sulfotransferase [Gemmatimonadota bacterium]|nr:sulfotransferase [Gemmatimonadota bacterium]